MTLGEARTASRILVAQVIELLVVHVMVHALVLMVAGAYGATLGSSTTDLPFFYQWPTYIVSASFAGKEPR